MWRQVRSLRTVTGKPQLVSFVGAAPAVSAGGATRSLLRVAMSIRWLSVVSIALALAVWQVLNALRVVSPDLVPGPTAVARTFVDILVHGYRGTTLLQDILATLYRVAAAFVLASILGIPLGLAMGYNRWIRAAFDYVVQLTRPLPPLSYYILLIVWLGTGNSSKIALLYLTAFPILVIDTMAGVRATPIQKIQAAQALGANEWQIFRYVILPSALPMIFSGMSIAMAVTFSTVVAAELLAASDGLGWMVFSASKFLRNDVIIMTIIVLGLLGVCLTRVIRALDKHVIHWRGVE